jgi:hypothetical protein
MPIASVLAQEHSFGPNALLSGRTSLGRIHSYRISHGSAVIAGGGGPDDVAGERGPESRSEPPVQEQEQG